MNSKRLIYNLATIFTALFISPVTLAGENVEAPAISAAYVTNAVFTNNNDYYNLYFNVEYTGAEVVEFSEEQGGISIPHSVVGHDGMARCEVTHLIAPLTTYISISVTNSKGTAKYSLVVPPQSPDKPTAVSLSCDALGDSHTSNANLQYQFDGTLPSDATDVLWIYSILAETGEMTAVKTQSDGENFTIPTVENASEWLSNDDCELTGAVLLRCKSADEFVGKDYPLTIELKPIITAVKETSKRFSTDGLTYDLTFTVDFAGSDAVSYDIMQSSPTFVPRHETVYGDGVAQCAATNLTCADDTEITITVENQYGTATSTLNLGPQNPKDPSGIEEAAIHATCRHVEIYSCDGLRIFAGHGIDAIDRLPTGIYIIKTFDSEGSMVTSKYLKR